MIILLHNCLAPMFAAVKSGRRHSTQVISKKQTVARPRSLEFIGFNLNSPTSLPIEFVLTSHFGKLSRNKWLSYLAGKSQTVHRSFYFIFLYTIFYLFSRYEIIETFACAFFIVIFFCIQSATCSKRPITSMLYAKYHKEAVSLKTSDPNCVTDIKFQSFLTIF